jgi:tRNA (mo5U34)-methyltransferase
MEQKIDLERIKRIKWHHTFDFGNGVKTPGGDNSSRKLKRLHLPKSLTGKTVLDVGAWDGFFSFEAERRGAARVLATDSFVWETIGREGFDFAKSALGSKVEDLHKDVLDLSPEELGLFDVVLFLGVLYHMRHPLLALEKVASVTGELLVVETVVDMLWYRRPAMAFYVGDELGNDQTNWVGPNVPALVGMLKTVGFKKVDIVAGIRPLPIRIAKAARSVYRYRSGTHFFSTMRTDRVVVHAWK